MIFSQAKTMLTKTPLQLEGLALYIARTNGVRGISKNPGVR